MRAGGAFRRENAGTSSKNAGESPARRKSKVSRATRIVPGLVGPKARLKGVADGRAGKYSRTCSCLSDCAHFVDWSVIWLLTFRKEKTESSDDVDFS